MEIPKRNGMKQTPLKRKLTKEQRVNSMTFIRNTLLRSKSLKQAVREKEYAALCHELKEKCRRDDGEYYSELDGRQKSFWSGGYHVIGLDCHHLDGRQNGRLLDPFNIICIGQDGEHRRETEHHTFERIQELKKIVYEIRIKQGYKPL